MNYIIFEQELRDALEKISTVQQVTFATACAARLARSYHWFIRHSGRGDIVQFDKALELAWSVSAGLRPNDDELTSLCSFLEGQVPHDDDDDWLLTSAIAQNALAAVIYALSTFSEGVEYSVWAARQLYDAADFLVQSKLPGPTFELDAPETDFAARVISDTLRAVVAGESVASIRQKAEADSERFEQFLPASIDSW